MYILYYVNEMINAESVCHIRIVKTFVIFVLQKCMLTVPYNTDCCVFGLLIIWCNMILNMIKIWWLENEC